MAYLRVSPRERELSQHFVQAVKADSFTFISAQGSSSHVSCAKGSSMECIAKRAFLIREWQCDGSVSHEEGGRESIPLLTSIHRPAPPRPYTFSISLSIVHV
jgi:hypothetical protein